MFLKLKVSIFLDFEGRCFWDSRIELPNPKHWGCFVWGIFLAVVSCLSTNIHGIVVYHPLSCWCWNNTIAPSHHNNVCLVHMPANYPIFFRRPRIRRYRCPSAYYFNTMASFHPLLISGLVFKWNPGPKGILVIVSTRSNHNSETQMSSLLRNISNLISVRHSSFLAPIVARLKSSIIGINGNALN